MKNTNDSNTDRCGKQTVKRNTILTQDYLSSTPLFFSLSLSRSWGYSKTSNPCPEKKMLNPHKKHKPQLQGLTQQHIHPPGLYYQPQTLRCTHHYPTDRERDQRRPLPQSPVDDQVLSYKLLNPKDEYNLYPSPFDHSRNTVQSNLL
jgi:hypothetical protein